MEEFNNTNELLYPQREAAFFYGLFLRGHSADALRRDIEVPPEVLAKWERDLENNPQDRGRLYRIVEFRRSVRAIFDLLVDNDTQQQRVQ
jgi:hypothetical protein